MIVCEIRLFPISISPPTYHPVNQSDVIFYQIIGNEVHIGGVFHTRENYTKKL